MSDIKREVEKFEADLNFVNNLDQAPDNELFNSLAEQERQNVVNGEETAEQAEEIVNSIMDAIEGSRD
jgi:fructose-1,6-bisphosphatase/inositol monophosphatase family enzyme